MWSLLSQIMGYLKAVRRVAWKLFGKTNLAYAERKTKLTKQPEVL